VRTGFSLLKTFRNGEDLNRYRCRSVLRVVICLLEYWAWLRYDAYWLRQASGVITAPEALTQSPNDWVTIAYHPLVGFDRLQGIIHSLTAWVAAPSWVWAPTAPSSSDVTCSIPTLQAPRPQVFTTSRQDTVRNDLRVYSTPQALLGFDLQRLHPGWSDAVPGTPDSFAVTRPSWLPFGWNLPFPRLDRSGFTQSRPISPDPSPPCSGQLPSWASVDLGVLLPTERASFNLGFHPETATAPLLVFFSFKVSLHDCPGRKPSPFGGCYPSKVLLLPWMASPNERGASLRGVFALWPELPLRARGYRGYGFPLDEAPTVTNGPTPA